MPRCRDKAFTQQMLARLDHHREELGQLAVDLLPAFYDVADPQRRMVRTTNPIERRFREVRRRTDSIGTFVNDASLERIVYGLVAYYNAKYAARVCKEFRAVRCVA